jgi:large subunit ribosomal protein L25
MEQKTLTIQERTETGKNAAGRIRRAGNIPCIMYGHSGKTSLTINAHEFDNKFKKMSENTIITLVDGKKQYEVLLKDYQEDIVTGKILHVDFYEIESGKALRTHVPIHAKGTAIGVKEGGLLEQLLHGLEIECEPKDLPQSINIDVTGLNHGDSIHVRDLKLDPAVKVLNNPEQVVFTIGHHKAEVVEEAAVAEAAAVPAAGAAAPAEPAPKA